MGDGLLRVPCVPQLTQYLLAHAVWSFRFAEIEKYRLSSVSLFIVYQVWRCLKATQFLVLYKLIMKIGLKGYKRTSKIWAAASSSLSIWASIPSET